MAAESSLVNGFDAAEEFFRNWSSNAGNAGNAEPARYQVAKFDDDDDEDSHMESNLRQFLVDNGFAHRLGELEALDIKGFHSFENSPHLISSLHLNAAEERKLDELVALRKEFQVQLQSQGPSAYVTYADFIKARNEEERRKNQVFGVNSDIIDLLAKYNMQRYEETFARLGITSLILLQAAMADRPLLTSNGVIPHHINVLSNAIGDLVRQGVLD